MAGRKGPRTSTPRLAVWAILMLLVGFGAGALFTTQGCKKKGRLPGDEEGVSPRPAPKRPGGRAPRAPEAPAPAPAEVPPAGNAHGDKEPREAPPEPEHPAPAPHPAPQGLPRMALVIDDLGYASPDLVTRLCGQSVPFSVAVLPYQEFTQVSAQIAHRAGKEVMLHLPMEPLGYPGPGKDPGPWAVLHDLPEKQIRDRVRKALAEIPFRVGVNNHMGSRITPDRTRMTWVLQEIRARHCFFVDSRTEKDSVAFDVARELAIPAVQRRVFLDDDKRYGEMARQWERALGLARKDGEVLIIGHIYPETVEALEKLIPSAKGKVTFVKAGQLVR